MYLDLKQIANSLVRVANTYPAELVADQLADVERIAFHISLAMGENDPADLSVCDLGGGLGLFSVGCKAVGFKRVVLVDDFSDSINSQLGESALDLHRGQGVEVVSLDVVGSGIDGAVDGDFDVVTSFDSMEHWHASPKRLFQQVYDRITPGGQFVLGTPNCVNMRKRITVPMGYGKWSKLEDWYEAERFRGHVREPDVDDLLYITQDMGLEDCRVFGRNWVGLASLNPVIRLASKISDLPLRIRPTLCSDIYVVGTKARGSD